MQLTIDLSNVQDREEKHTLLGRDILVDGYNVIKRGPSFQAAHAQSLAEARERLITLLTHRYRHTPHRVFIVFDGDRNAEQVTNHNRYIHIIYSQRGVTADAVIARLTVEAREQGREAEIFSDDSEVRQTAIAQGSIAQTTTQLERQIYAAPRDDAKRSKFRQAMRKKYGFEQSAFEKDKDEDEDLPSLPGKKKKKRR